MNVLQLTPGAYVGLALFAVIALMYFLVSGKLMKSNPEGRMITIGAIILLVSMYEYDASLDQCLPALPFDPNPVQALIAVYAVFILGLLIFIAEYKRSSSRLIQRYANLLLERTNILELSAATIGLMASVTLVNCLVFAALLSLVIGFELIKAIYQAVCFEESEEEYRSYIGSQTLKTLKEVEKSKSSKKTQNKVDKLKARLKKLELECSEASKNGFYDLMNAYIDIFWIQIALVFDSKKAPKKELCVPIVKYLYQIQNTNNKANSNPDNYKILKNINKRILDLIVRCLQTEETKLMEELISEKDENFRGFKNYLQELIENKSKILENIEHPMYQNRLDLVKNIQCMLNKTQDESTIRFLNQLKEELSQNLPTGKSEKNS